jgi:hypothetical protein
VRRSVYGETALEFWRAASPEGDSDAGGLSGHL